MNEVQELVARLRLRDEMTGPLRKVRSGVSGVSDALNSPRMQRGISQIGTGIRNATKIATVGIVALATQIAAGLQSLVELEKAQAQTEAVIKSTGGVAGITAAEVRNLAEKYEALNAMIGDETIQETENLLLTFTRIREKAFEPALEAILDMNTAMGGGPEGLKNTVIQVGKALNDPITGLTALRRVGVTFTRDQEKQIKALVETGDLLGAQRLIIKELDTEFGGSFLGQGATTAGKVAKFRDSIEDLQRTLATALLPTVGRVADKLSEFLAKPEVIRGAEELGKKIAGLFSDKNLAEGGRIFGEVFAAAKDAAPVIAAAAQTTAGFVRIAVDVFRQLPPEIQKLAIGAFAVNKLTGGLVTNVAGGLTGTIVNQILGKIRGAVVHVQGAVVHVGGGVPGVPGVAGAGTGVLGTAAKVAAGATAVGLPIVIAHESIGAIGDATGVPIREANNAVRGAVEAAHAADKATQEATRAALVDRLNFVSSNLSTVGNLVHRAGERTTGAVNTAQRILAGAATRTKDDISSAVKRSGDSVGETVRNKKMSVSVTNQNNISLSIRDQIIKQKSITKFGAVAV